MASRITHVADEESNIQNITLLVNEFGPAKALQSHQQNLAVLRYQDMSPNGDQHSRRHRPRGSRYRPGSKTPTRNAVAGVAEFCRVPGCQTRVAYKTPRGYREHLILRHNEPYISAVAAAKAVFSRDRHSRSEGSINDYVSGDESYTSPAGTNQPDTDNTMTMCGYGTTPMRDSIFSFDFDDGHGQVHDEFSLSAIRN
ncbi:hypothetical protein AAFC00_002311 [Neodothiora populina]|uniref:C2H2-type domain-containing protein n=1 Tax=Neodothiora populina TaxID=2781224 RepID=A0ABR3PH14_9PEZI